MGLLATCRPGTGRSKICGQRPSISCVACRNWPQRTHPGAAWRSPFYGLRRQPRSTCIRAVGRTRMFGPVQRPMTCERLRQALSLCPSGRRCIGADLDMKSSGRPLLRSHTPGADPLGVVSKDRSRIPCKCPPGNRTSTAPNCRRATSLPEHRGCWFQPEVPQVTLARVDLGSPLSQSRRSPSLAALSRLAERLQVIQERKARQGPTHLDRRRIGPSRSA
jgi:hypothetical protein